MAKAIKKKLAGKPRKKSVVAIDSDVVKIEGAAARIDAMTRQPPVASVTVAEKLPNPNEFAILEKEIRRAQQHYDVMDMWFDIWNNWRKSHDPLMSPPPDPMKTRRQTGLALTSEETKLVAQLESALDSLTEKFIPVASVLEEFRSAMQKRADRLDALRSNFARKTGISDIRDYRVLAGIADAKEKEAYLNDKGELF